MKLNPDFIVHNTETESILVPSGNAAFSGIVRGNKTLGLIAELLKEDVTEEELIAGIRSRFDAPEGVVEKDVEKALAELRKIGALTD